MPGDEPGFVVASGKLDERGSQLSMVSKVRTHSRSSFKIHGGVDSDRHFGRVRLLPPTLEATMQTVADRPPTAIRTDLGAIFLSLELSRSFLPTSHPWR